MRILLIEINTRWFGMKHWHDIPYGICLLKAALKDKHTVKVLDANFLDLDEAGLTREIRDYEPDLVGISCMSMEYRKTLLRTAQLSKQAAPKAVVAAGGVYPTLLPEEIISEESFDFIVMGEGEIRFERLLRRLESGNGGLESVDGLCYRKDGEIIVQPVKSYIDNLDDAPYPDHSDLDFHKYASFATKYNFYIYPRRFPYAKTITSRGCPFRCTFCSSRFIHGKKIRYRSAENVLGEIDWLVDKYGIKEIIFLDDNLIVNRKRIVAILNGLLERKYDLAWKAATNAAYALDDELLELMKETGCYQMNLAIESGSEHTLKLIRKPLKLDKVREVVAKSKQLGFEITGGFIFGLPGETWEDIRQTFSFAESLNIDYCAFNIANPLPRTELLDICRERGNLVRDFEFSDSRFDGFGVPNIRTPEFEPGELVALRAFEWDRINFKNEEVNKRIARINGISPQDIEPWRLNTRRKALKLIHDSLK